ncbi:general transcription repressor, partial [Tieghemiomyces parasiticus]
MSNIYNHRAMVPNSAPVNRIPDLLETLKVEFENLSQEVQLAKGARDEPDSKGAGNHIQELTAIQQSLNDLQRSHLTIKQKYEEEIARLQKELEMRGGPPAPGAAGAAPGSAHAPPPPAIGQGGS